MSEIQTITSKAMATRWGAWLVGLIMGCTTFGVSYLAANLLPYDIARYESVVAVKTAVAAGENVELRVHYTKFRDCGGDAMIVLHSEGIPVGRVIGQNILGSRAPGSWLVTRRAMIPLDAEKGPASIQEILSYDCGLVGQIVKSPIVGITITAKEASP